MEDSWYPILCPVAKSGLPLGGDSSLATYPVERSRTGFEEGLGDVSSKRLLPLSPLGMVLKTFLYDLFVARARFESR
jgi:hypothetical protein